MHKRFQYISFSLVILITLTVSLLLPTAALADGSTTPPPTDPTQVAVTPDSGVTGVSTDAATQPPSTDVVPTNAAATQSPSTDIAPTSAVPTDAVATQPVLTSISPTDITTTDVAATPSGSTSVVPTDSGPTDAVVTETPIPPTAVATETPAGATQSKDLTGVVSALADANAVVTDANGNPVPLASQSAANALSGEDPWFDAGGGVIVGYSSTGTCAAVVTECHTSTTPIQSTINDVRSDNKTIHVEAGTYVEQIVINKSLSLVGAGAGNTIIQAPTTLASDPDGTKTIALFTGSISAEFSGFTVQGPVDGLNYGIYVRDGANVSIHDNTIKDIRDNPLSGNQSGVAIQVGKQSKGQTGTANISNNLIVGFQKNGITVDNTGSSATISGNVITGAGPTNLNAQNGIQISRGATGAIENNTVTLVDYTGGYWTSAGILLYAAGDGVNISDNTIQHNQTSVYVQDSNNVQMTGNVFSDTTLYDNIDLYNVNGATISGNTILNSYYDGIWAGSSKNITVTGNQFSGNGFSAGDPNASAFELAGGSYTNTLSSFSIHGNAFAGNLNGIWNYDTTSVDATGNWWGSVSGPTTVQNTSGTDVCGVSANPGASGSGISQCVLYGNWLVSNPFASTGGSVGGSNPIIVPAVIPVTGGQQITIGCDTPSVTMQVNGVQVVFTGLCGYDVILDAVTKQSLPGNLGTGNNFVEGITIALLKDNKPVTTLPASASISVSYLKPATGNPIVMSWNGGSWDEIASSNSGGRVTISSTDPGTFVLVTK